MYGFPGEIERGTDNLYNNNIYIYKYIKCTTTNNKQQQQPTNKQTNKQTTTTTIISEGADPLRPVWGHPTEGQSLRASPEYV